MPELMLKPGWPNTFRRSIGEGKKARTLVFKPNQPVDVKPSEIKDLGQDIGVALFEIERDEKGRPRFVETVASQPDPTMLDEETAASVAHV